MSENNAFRRNLRLIAVFKLIKVVALIAVGISVLKLVHGGAVDTLYDWITTLGLNPDGHYVDLAVGKVAGMPPERLKEFGFASFLYAGLFLVEGTGLWLQKRWGEWVTVFITSSLVPLEVFELFHHPSVAKGFMLIANLGIVVYLVANIRRQDA
ncbi:DUF2127 domain-containing protein [Terriglobus aquaticus]|uniref:DUF2127 domain-containing protein n=1 Tax=Terriglobus aquaticus TaxID=940139 RepID=A0ABW9KNY9_9BACT|nr:DUF2127 domain-containing protein [Terriglobus aquaticus]